MIELIEFPFSPFCIVIRKILEFAQTPFKRINIAPSDRSLVWRLTRERYYQVPIIKDGKAVIFETDDTSQVIAKYLDDRLELGLFPRRLDGVQAILWRYFESDIEGAAFRLNDIYYKEFLPRKEWLPFLRHKERKFGKGCLENWQTQQARLQSDLEERLMPCEQMLSNQPFLLEDRPRFVDFNLFGMLGNYLYSGRYTLPNQCPLLQAWHARMIRAKHSAARAE